MAGLGFEPVLADNLDASHYYLAGPDSDRLDAFHRLAADPTVAAIVFARGGYGVPRLLDRIDWPLLARHPRAYVGYSDLTPFLLGVVQHLGIAAFHGPMVAGDFARGMDEIEVRSFLDAVGGRLPSTLPITGWWRRGPAEGRLVGGCLSMLTATLGTPHFPDLSGAVLVLEDVGERLYRVDRMLTQLRLSGELDDLAGLVLGHVDLLRGEDSEVLETILAEVLGGYSWPVARGLPSGHSPPNLTLPLGLRCSLNTDSDQLVVGIS